MALPDTLAARLIETVKDHDLSGDFLMLGRQRWVGSRKDNSAKLLKETIAKYLPDLQEEDLKNADNEYSERFFHALGFQSVDSMDFSDFEGASVIQDLSADLEPELVGRFDVIYDGGTCEHIFDLPKAYRNLDQILRPGGVLIGHSPCNNWINHAFYQICPEMVFSYWQRSRGYEILHISLQPLMPHFAYHVASMTNPNKTGKRPRIDGELPKAAPLILNYVVRKPSIRSQCDPGVYQTDYTQKWNE